MRATLFFLFAVWAVLPGITLAQENWVGKTILLKRPGVKISTTTGDAILARRPNYKVLEDSPARVQVKSQDAIGWLDRSDAVLLEDAVAFFTARIKTDPADAWAFQQRALARIIENKNEDDAIKDCTEAIRLDPKLVFAFQSRARSLGIRNDLRLEPKNAYFHFMRAALWKGKGNVDAALADLTEAFRLDPKLTQAYGYRASVWAGDSVVAWVGVAADKAAVLRVQVPPYQFSVSGT